MTVNDRLATVLNDLAKQGKLNQQQIMQVTYANMLNCIHVLRQPGRINLIQFFLRD